MADLYLSIKKSIHAWTYDIGQGLNPPIESFDFDATAEEEEIAQEDLIGPIELYTSGGETLGEVGFKVVGCTHNDPQIQRLNILINEIVNHVGGRVVTIPILHHETGVPLGMLSSDGNFFVGPVVRLPSKNRPFQTVSLLFNLTLTF